MQWISKTPEGTRHAVDGFRYRQLDDDRQWRWHADTRCGRQVAGHSGGCIAPLIDCGNCRRSLRKDGWLV